MIEVLHIVVCYCGRTEKQLGDLQTLRLSKAPSDMATSYYDPIRCFSTWKDNNARMVSCWLCPSIHKKMLDTITSRPLFLARRQTSPLIRTLQGVYGNDPAVWTTSVECLPVTLWRPWYVHFLARCRTKMPLWSLWPLKMTASCANDSNRRWERLNVHVHPTLILLIHVFRRLHQTKNTAFFLTNESFKGFH